MKTKCCVITIKTIAPCIVKYIPVKCIMKKFSEKSQITRWDFLKLLNVATCSLWLEVLTCYKQLFHGFHWCIIFICNVQ